MMKNFQMNSGLVTLALGLLLSGAAQASLTDVPDSALAGKRVLVRVDFNVPQ